MVTRCTGSCIELADTVVPEFVIPSRSAARVSFEADMLDDLGEDMIYPEMFCANMAVLTLPARDGVGPVVAPFNPIWE